MLAAFHADPQAQQIGSRYRDRSKGHNHHYTFIAIHPVWETDR
jgi:hypothetical protein